MLFQPKTHFDNVFCRVATHTENSKKKKKEVMQLAQCFAAYHIKFCDNKIILSPPSASMCMCVCVCAASKTLPKCIKNEQAQSADYAAYE